MKLDFAPVNRHLLIASTPLSEPSPIECRPSFTDIVEEARLSARALLDYGESFFNPTVRLGVTGLSRAGKTVFITALIHGLTRGGRFPVFEALALGPHRARRSWRRSPTTRCRASTMRTICAR